MDIVLNGEKISGRTITIERHLELLRKETDRERRQLRKTLAFGAMYSGNPNARVFMPDHLLEDEDRNEK